MKLTHNKSRTIDVSKITFTQMESWNPLHNTATMAIDVDKIRVLCRISKAVLMSISSDKKADPMKILANNRSLFQNKAKKLIEQNKYESDGSIIIRKSDM